MADPIFKGRTFFVELRRRKVFRVAVGYGVVAFILLQLAEIIFPALQLPDWSLTFLVVLLFLGFPVALVLAWAFETTPDGIRRTVQGSAEARLTAGLDGTHEGDQARGVRGWSKTLAPYVIMAGLVVIYLLRQGSSVEPRETPIRSIAVLPLDNYSRDPAEEYFTDGMTEALTASLAQIRALKVISRSSAMRYKTDRPPLPEIGKALNVDAVIEGSVLHAGNRVRISVQLIHAETDVHLWAKSYEGEVTNVLTLQAQVARAIAEEIKVQLTPAEDQALKAARLVDPQAFDAYVRGRYHWNKRTAEGMRKAIEYFNRAIARDPTYALAYSGLADAYALLPSHAGAPGDEAYPKAKAAALKALELNPNLGAAYATLGLITQNGGGRWSEAEEYFKTSLDLNPNYATVHHWYGLFLGFSGSVDGYRREIGRAAELDPLSAIIRANIGYGYYFSRQYDEMISEAESLLEFEPGFGVGKTLLGLGYLMKGRMADALQLAQEAVALGLASDPNTLALLGCAYAATGEQDQALLILKKLETERFADMFFMDSWLLISHSLGRTDEIFAFLEEALTISNNPHLLEFVQIDPGLESLTQDPRFAALKALGGKDSGH